MNSILALVLAAVAGLGLGLFFYGGLYLTVTRGLNSARPGLWFFISFILRMSVVLAGFYLINDGHWQRLASCLASFMITGVVFRLWQQKSSTRRSAAEVKPLDTHTTKDGSRSHAP